MSDSKAEQNRSFKGEIFKIFKSIKENYSDIPLSKVLSRERPHPFPSSNPICTDRERMEAKV